MEKEKKYEIKIEGTFSLPKTEYGMFKAYIKFCKAMDIDIDTFDMIKYLLRSRNHFEKSDQIVEVYVIDESISHTSFRLETFKNE